MQDLQGGGSGSGSSSIEDDSEDADEDVDCSRRRLKARFLAELRQRRQHELTARLLQQNYDDLLRSHAEKEITIEQLRLGARVSLVVDPPVPGQALTGSLPTAQRPLAFSLPRTAVATTASSAIASQPALSVGL